MVAVLATAPWTPNRDVAARAIAPRKPLTVSQWADAERILSRKQSAEPGRWRTERNPPLREVMDALSARSSVRDIVVMFPIQFGKSEIALNLVGYTMAHHPGPIMVCLPGEVSRNKWIDQKLTPMLEETPALAAALTSTASRNSANRADFKDFAGGQLYLEHAGSPARLKSSSVRTLIVDELDEFSGNYQGGDDPVELVKGRTSAFPGTAKRLFISTPTLAGTSRIAALYAASDRRRFHLPCPDCGHAQALEWSGLHWSPDAAVCEYACRECGATNSEARWKSQLPRGTWVAEAPEARTRGYHINALYYPIGLGPRWLDLVEMWRAAQNDPAKLKTFVNDRLAEVWEDPAMRAVKHNILADRAEPYRLREAPAEVLAITAGVDTQDNRLAIHIIGWTRRGAHFTLDYVELPGDPADDVVWLNLTDLINRPIAHASGATLRIEATAIDAGGHRTEAVKAFVRRGLIRRPMCIFGAVPNNAPVLSKPKLVDVNWRGQLDKRGVHIHHVGTVAVKHLLYSRISADHDKPREARMVRLSEDLPPEFFAGLVSETYNPTKNRFEKRTGARNEPLDTWVYAFAAGHHPELRLHRRSQADWDAVEARLTQAGAAGTPPGPVPPPAPTTKPTAAPWMPRRGGWMNR
jgi:phage terminase large subunit GpA-like protein